jgi:protein TIF31
MVIRSFKHVIRAAIAAVDDMQNMSAVIAETLNILLGSPILDNDLDTDAHNEHKLRLKWIESFLSKRYCWKLKDEFEHLRKSIILRGLCSKVHTVKCDLQEFPAVISKHGTNVFVDQVGLELIARDYDMNSPNPFDKSDIVNIVPICKVAYY